jgi:hypothetical protein
VQNDYYGSWTIQTFTYQVQATPETTTEYYKNELSKDGWEYQAESSFTDTKLRFAWSDSWKRNESVFELQVVMTDTNSMTTVELMLKETVPH